MVYGLNYMFHLVLEVLSLLPDLSFFGALESSGRVWCIFEGPEAHGSCLTSN